MLYILLGNGFEEIEAIAPCDILRRGGVEVMLAGIGGLEITSAHGITVRADCRVEDVRKEDTELLMLPGGMGGVQSIEGSRAAMKLISDVYEDGRLVAAICAAPTVLAHLGILKGKKAVCYPGMEEQCTDARMTQEASTVRDGNVITGRGPGAGLDFGFRLLSELRGKACAEEVRAAMHV